MKIKNTKRWAPGGVRPWALAVAAIMVAFGLRYVIHPVLQGHLPLLTFMIAALLVEFFAGLGPALLVVASGLVIGAYFFVPPFRTLAIPEGPDLFFLAYYFSINFLGIFLIESLQRARCEARLLKDVAQSRFEMLERSNAERSRAEKAAQRSNERFQSLASSMPHVWYMRRLDGNFEYVNDRFYEYTGLEPGSLEGGGWLKAIHPDDVGQVKAIWRRTAETGKDEFSGLRLRMADGSFRRFEGQLSCIEDKRGKIIRWAGVSAELQTPEASAVYS